ncbi:Asp-tRNA(Asn)/Glu-tRNA(Gln) amidotransferase subunit GatA [Coprothermobacteraceae bacterium]|nr:Asp-tRNA(Asn)/Glu-tRNA(Gln) amidotransferase subunit GatA [Coprothermobacteraceae bacterium]
MKIGDIFERRQRGELTFQSIMELTLNNLEKDELLHAFLYKRPPEELMKEAQQADALWDQGIRKPLQGIPVAIKDNICVEGLPCTCGSKILENYVAPYDATVVKKLKEAGAIIVGKTNLDEFAMGSSTENSAFGPTRNPLDTNLVPGGSSGGSAAAVAAGMSLLALGSDTGGSVRQPAAFTGIVGFKPSYGAISRYGLVAFASSLDQIGIFAANTMDALLGAFVLFGKDPMDSTSTEIPIGPEPSQHNVRRIGVIKELSSLGLQPDVERVYTQFLNTLAKQYELVEVSIPHWEEALAAYYFVAPAEASANLARYDGVRYGSTVEANTYWQSVRMARSLFGDEVKRRILLGTFALSAGYKDAMYDKAQALRQWLIYEFNEAFRTVDIIVSPTTPNLPFPIGAVSDPVEMYKCDLFTIPANLAYLPAISVPAGFTGNLPVGAQFIAPRMQDYKLLSFAASLEVR